LELDLRSLMLFLCIALAAALYSSVGLGGGSGYLAVMALFGTAPEVMRPAALSMNLAVSSVVWWRLRRAGYFRMSLFWPFVLTSIPMAFIGGMLRLDNFWYQLLVGAALLLAAGRLLQRPVEQQQIRDPRRGPALIYGAAIGLLSGSTGVGGGIFLSPLLLLLRWCSLRENFALAAAFVWVNSLAALLGYAWSEHPWPGDIPFMVVAALLGTVAGLLWSERLANPLMLQRILGFILVIAAGKMVLGW